jgi:hypothetical protein
MTTQYEMPASTPVEPEVKEFLAGFERVEAEVRAMTERDLVPVNLDTERSCDGSRRAAGDCRVA